MGMMPKLTPTQADVLAYIGKCQDDIGAAPSFRQISKKFVWASARAPACHLDALEAKGYITRSPNNARAIKINRIHEVAIA